MHHNALLEIESVKKKYKLPIVINCQILIFKEFYWILV